MCLPQSGAVCGRAESSHPAHGTGIKSAQRAPGNWGGGPRNRQPCQKVMSVSCTLKEKLLIKADRCMS